MSNILSIQYSTNRELRDILDEKLNPPPFLVILLMELKNIASYIRCPAKISLFPDENSTLLKKVVTNELFKVLPIAVDTFPIFLAEL